MLHNRGRISYCAVLLTSCLACSTPAAKESAAPDQVGAQASSPGVSEVAAKYEGKLIRLAVTGEESARVYIVKNGRKQWVTSIDWIKSQGFKWPDDVKPISREEMNLIPDGPPAPDK